MSAEVDKSAKCVLGRGTSRAGYATLDVAVFNQLLNIGVYLSLSTHLSGPNTLSQAGKSTT